MKTLKINEDTHKELTKMKGELMAQNGNPDLTYDQVIMELIKAWKKVTE